METSVSTPHFLDITRQVCPLTFVKARLALERLEPGSELVIRLGSGEPLETLPRSLAELGYRVVSLEPEAEAPGTGIHRLVMAKD